MALEVAAEDWHHRFAAGALTVVLGRNGAGKSSLCRAIAGLPSPMVCRVLLDGRDLAGVSARKRDVAIVFQAFVNYPSLTVRDNIASPLVAARRPRDEIANRVGELAERLGLDDLLERRPSTLSGGQQQRLAIARALAKGARILLLDEPFANLDYKLREQLARELRGLTLASGTTVIYTTADPHEALALGDDTLLLDAARAIQRGPPFEIYRAPRSFAAADLFSDPGVNRLPRRTAVVRPDHVRLDERPGDLRFAGRVLLGETNGSETVLHLEVDSETWVARVDRLHECATDATVDLFVAPADVLEVSDG